MIIALRKYIKGPVFKASIWFFIAGLTGIVTLAQIFSNRDSSPWIALVNGDKITYNDYRRNVGVKRDYLVAFRAQYGEYADLLLQSMGLSADPGALALDQLVRNELINQVVVKSGVQLDQAKVHEQMANPLFVQQELSDIVPVSAFNRDGSINYNSLDFYLRKVGISRDVFNEKVEKALGRRLMASLVSRSSYLPEFELKQRFVEKYASKKFSVLTFSYDKALGQEKKKDITDKELKVFFDRENARAKRYQVTENRSATVWKFEPEDYAISLNERDIKDYYEDNKIALFRESPTKVQVRQIVFTIGDKAKSAEVEAKALSIRKELIEKPGTFAQVAKKVSDDQVSAQKGGMLPFFARGELEEKALERAALILKKDGDISKVIRLKDGFAIVQRVEKKKSVYKTLASARKDIKKALKNKKFRKLFVRDMEKIAGRAGVDEKALKSFIKDKAGKSENQGDITRTDAAWGSQLFKMKKGELAFYVEKGVGIAVRLENVKPSFTPGLSTLKDAVRNDLYEERAHKALNAQVKKARVVAGKDGMAEANKMFGGKIEDIGFVSSNDAKMIAGLKKREVPIDIMLAMAVKGAVSSHLQDNNGYVIRLNALGDFDQATFDAKKAEIVQDFAREQSQLTVEGFVASLYRNATIETNESMLHTS